MGKFDPTVESVEGYIEDLKKALAIGAGNVPSIEELEREDYREAVEKTEYWSYVQSADYHYFISRILFLHHITSYSYFCGHQCLENYLKAYLKFKNQHPPNEHILRNLLGRCRSISPSSDSFIHGENISIIVAKYEPFYELARYPVQKKRPKSGYAFLIPDDIYVLDYFVMKMRQILSIPDNTWDILKHGHYDLHQCQRSFPSFYNLFFANNINFAKY